MLILILLVEGQECPCDFLCKTYAYVLRQGLVRMMQAQCHPGLAIGSSARQTWYGDAAAAVDTFLVAVAVIENHILPEPFLKTPSRKSPSGGAVDQSAGKGRAKPKRKAARSTVQLQVRPGNNDYAGVNPQTVKSTIARTTTTTTTTRRPPGDYEETTGKSLPQIWGYGYIFL